MNRFTLMFCNGNTIDFESDQTVFEIMDVLNADTEDFINIGEAATIQKYEIAAIYDNDQTYKF